MEFFGILHCVQDDSNYKDDCNSRSSSGMTNERQQQGSRKDEKSRVVI